MIHHEFSCDFRGCTERVPSADLYGPEMPPTWGFSTFAARTDDNESCRAEAHLCPEHAVVVGQLLGRWTVGVETAKTPPARFR